MITSCSECGYWFEKIQNKKSDSNLNRFFYILKPLTFTRVKVPPFWGS